MRADRAYIAGIGTTSVLVASAVLLFAVVSTLVAFRGWPGTDLAEDIGNLVVGDSQRTVAVEGPRRIAAEAAPAAGAVAAAPAPGTAAAASVAAASVAQARTTRAPAVRVPPRRGVFRPEGTLTPGTAIRPTPDEVSGQPGSLLPRTPISSEVERVTTGLGDATQGLTDGLGQTVGDLSPALGATLTDTGRLLADILRALGAPPP